MVQAPNPCRGPHVNSNQPSGRASAAGPGGIAAGPRRHDPDRARPAGPMPARSAAASHPGTAPAGCRPATALDWDSASSARP